MYQLYIFFVICAWTCVLINFAALAMTWNRVKTIRKVLFATTQQFADGERFLIHIGTIIGVPSALAALALRLYFVFVQV